MTRSHLVIIMLSCLGGLGCLVAVNGIQGIRHGQFRYKGNWLNRHEDGILFWLVTVTAIISGLGVVLCAIWFVLEYGIHPPA